jgi:hypothetical protein
VATIPEGYHYDINEYDGMESLKIIPPTKTVMAELIAIAQKYAAGMDNVELHPMTRDLIAGKLTMSEFLHPKCDE